MDILDSIEGIFQDWRASSGCLKAALTIATVVGLFYLTILLLRALFGLIQGLRLYVFSQIFKTDYVKKYGKWALVTGSTDGIGLAMAKELARRGHSIILVGRSAAKLANCKAMVEAEPNVGDVETVKIDLADPSLHNFERVRAQIDPDKRDIGILINNAGIMASKLTRFHLYDSQFLRDLVNVNILASVYFTKMVIPGMLARKRGLIVNVSSVYGSIPAIYTGVYGATKTFLDAFRAQLEVEFASDNIDIINLRPGAVGTKLFDAVTNGNVDPLVKLTTPTPESYARTAINSLSTGIGNISGCLIHAVAYCLSMALLQVGLFNPFYKFVIRDFKADTVN